MAKSMWLPDNLFFMDFPLTYVTKLEIHDCPALVSLLELLFQHGMVISMDKSSPMKTWFAKVGL